MRLRTTVATVTALGAAALAPLALAVPAQADQASARASFRQIALDALAGMESRDAGPTRTYEAWLSSFQASLTAYRDGWHDPKVAALLERVYDQKIGTDGYGINYSWDAFGNGRDEPGDSKNAPDTVYTVTVTDHVGEPLLEGYRAGVVPRVELQYLADALWRVPSYRTGGQNPDVPGKCMAYSNSVFDQPANLDVEGRYWCVINVSAGAAAFLHELLDEGIVPEGATAGEVQALIEDLGAFVEYAHGKGGAGTGYWAYSYRSADDRYQPGNSKSPQDLNHNAYTGESAYDLGLSSGTVALDRLNDSTDYIVADDNGTRDNAADIDTYGREVKGRMRALGAKPSAVQRNMLAEAQWWARQTTRDSIMSLAQEGRWAARLAQVATARSGRAREVGFMAVPRIFPASWRGRGNEAPVTTVRRGVRYIVYTDARFYDAGNRLQFITNVRVRLLSGRNGAAPRLLAAKPTGFDWYGARFAWTPRVAIGTRVKFCARVTAGQDSTFNSACRTVRVQ